MLIKAQLYLKVFLGIPNFVSCITCINITKFQTTQFKKVHVCCYTGHHNTRVILLNVLDIPSSK